MPLDQLITGLLSDKGIEVMRFYKRVTEGKTTTVESCSHNLPVTGATEIDQAEFDAFIEAIPKPDPAPVKRDLTAEFDSLRSQLVFKGIIEDS